MSIFNESRKVIADSSGTIPEEYRESLGVESIHDNVILEDSDDDLPLPERKKIKKTSLLNLDTAYRNQGVYPDSNNCKLDLDRNYYNIVAINLISIEFPNMDQSVNSDYTKISWINYEDSPTFPVYTVTLTPGNYSSNSLVTELKTQMNSVLDGTGNNHFFNIEYNLDTGLVDIGNIRLTVLSENPISVTANSNIINVQNLSHTFSVDDTIFLYGVRGFIGGISPAVINGYHTVTSVSRYSINKTNNVLDLQEGSTVIAVVIETGVYSGLSALLTAVQTALNNYGGYSPNYTVTESSGIVTIANTSTFSLLWNSGSNTSRSIASTLGFSTAADDTSATSYDSDSAVTSNSIDFKTTIPSALTTTGGGKSVRSGELLQFKFLFNSESDGLWYPLGFPNEDTSENVTVNMSTYYKQITDYTIGDNTIFTSVGHGLTTGETVKIFGLISTPDINKTSRIFSVVVLTSDTFSITFRTTRISSDSSVYFSTNKVLVTHTSHGFSTGNTLRIYGFPTNYTIGGTILAETINKVQKRSQL